MIRPLLLFDRRHRGGGPRHVWDLAHALRPATEPMVYGVDGLGVADALEMARYARAFGATHLHSHSKRTAVLAWGATWLTGLPWVHTFHGLHPERYFGWKRRLYVALERQLARRRAATIHVSQSQADFAAALGLPGVVIANGVARDGPPPTPAAWASRGRLRVLAVGRWDDPVKGLDVLLRAVAPGVHLVLAGRLPARLKPVAGVTAIGEVADVAPWYAAADCLAAASWAEGCPYAVLDAMAWGLPVVATGVRGHVDLVQHGRTGWLTMPGEGRALGRALQALGEDPERSHAMGRAGAERILARHRVEPMAQSTRAVYAEARSARPRKEGGRG